MTVDSLKQLFSHELRDMYAGEHEVLDALEEMENNESNQELKQVFSEHREETQGQIDRLEEVFQTVGESPEKKGGEGLGGIIEEHDSFMKMEPTEEVHTAYDVGAGEKVERYEITAYEDLTMMGKALGLSDDELQPLQENLSEEREQLDRLENFSQNFDLSKLQTQSQ